MKHTVKVMPSIPKEAERHFVSFKNNDGPSSQVHLQGVSGAGEDCSSSSHRVGCKLSRQQLSFLSHALNSLGGDMTHVSVSMNY